MTLPRMNDGCGANYAALDANCSAGRALSGRAAATTAAGQLVGISSAPIEASRFGPIKISSAWLTLGAVEGFWM